LLSIFTPVASLHTALSANLVVTAIRLLLHRARRASRPRTYRDNQTQGPSPRFGSWRKRWIICEVRDDEVNVRARAVHARRARCNRSPPPQPGESLSRRFGAKRQKKKLLGLSSRGEPAATRSRHCSREKSLSTRFGAKRQEVRY